MPGYFYVDGARTQQGPVTAEAMQKLWTSGAVDATTLCFADDGSPVSYTHLTLPTICSV